MRKGRETEPVYRRDEARRLHLFDGPSSVRFVPGREGRDASDAISTRPFTSTAASSTADRVQNSPSQCAGKFGRAELPVTKRKSCREVVKWWCLNVLQKLERSTGCRAGHDPGSQICLHQAQTVQRVGFSPRTVRGGSTGRPACLRGGSDISALAPQKKSSPSLGKASLHKYE